MRGRPGKMVELKDGRKGIVYDKDQVLKGRLVVKLIGDDLFPVISDKTGEQKMIFADPKELTLIGFFD